MKAKKIWICKLLEICTTQMRSIISGRSGIIVVNFAVRYKKPDWEAIGAISYLIKHEFGDFKRIGLESI